MLYGNVAQDFTFNSTVFFLVSGYIIVRFKHFLSSVKKGKTFSIVFYPKNRNLIDYIFYSCSISKKQFET